MPTTSIFEMMFKLWLNGMSVLTAGLAYVFLFGHNPLAFFPALGFGILALFHAVYNNRKVWCWTIRHFYAEDYKSFNLEEYTE